MFKVYKFSGSFFAGLEFVVILIVMLLMFLDALRFSFTLGIACYSLLNKRQSVFVMLITAYLD